MCLRGISRGVSPCFLNFFLLLLCGTVHKEAEIRVSSLFVVSQLISRHKFSLNLELTDLVSLAD